MRVSFNWLKQFVELPKGFTAEDVAAKLTLTTVEVESVQRLAANLDQIVVAKILTVKPHPNADKLSVLEVDTGSRTVEVVCGGTNVAAGMLVALAKVGATVQWPGGELAEIKPAKIRGVNSDGMVCASSELGLSHLFPGGEREIADLSALNVTSGTPLAAALGLDDAVLDIDNKSMTHRADLWGHWGLARELAAALKVPFTTPAPVKIKPSRSKHKPLVVTVADKQKCRRYLAVVIDKVTVAPSPAWMTSRLEAAGIRPINVIVDITNYVMLELGQPLHAFDYRQVTDGQIVVGPATDGETFMTLDGQERTMSADMLMIRDGARPLAIAGIMGGEASGITDSTKTIVFESANFAAGAVRQTSLRLNLRSESSARFEKNIDPVLAELALQRAVALTQELIPGAVVASKVIDVNVTDQPPVTIDCTPAWIAERIGADITAEWIRDTLSRLGLVIKETKKGPWTVTVPFWRHGDLRIAEDLVEEVARLYGYDALPTALPTASLTVPVADPELALASTIKHFLTGSIAATETLNYSFVSPTQVVAFGLNPADHLALKNALSADQGLLRSTLLMNLVQNVAANLRFYSTMRLIEVGRVFSPAAGTELQRPGSDQTLPDQERRVAGAVVAAGQRSPFYVVKGMVEALLEHLGADFYLESTGDVPPYYEPARSLVVFVRGQSVGFVGELRQSVAVAHDVGPLVGVFELSLPPLVAAAGATKIYRPLAKHPAVVRDMAMILATTVPWEELRQAIRTAGQPLVAEIELFDEYVGGTIPAGQRSLAWHVTYQADRTLTSVEVDMVEAKILAALTEEFGATLRK